MRVTVHPSSSTAGPVWWGSALDKRLLHDAHCCSSTAQKRVLVVVCVPARPFREKKHNVGGPYMACSTPAGVMLPTTQRV